MMNDQQTFSGGVFHESIEGGRAGAEISIDTQAVVARLQDDQQFSLRFEKLQLETGGASGKMVFCRNEDRSLTIFSEAKGFLKTLEHSGGLLTNQKVDQVKKTRRSNRRKSRRSVLIGLAVIVLLGWGIFELVVYGARTAVTALPISIDQQIGEFAMESMDLQGPILEDEVVASAIKSMIDRLQPHAAIEGFQYKVTVVEADIMNAFALPGGNLVVYTGLISKADRPEQVAGVLAHEIAHVTKRHGLQRIGQTIGISGLASLLAGDIGGLAVLSELLQFSTINKYSRDHETEADLEGVRMLLAAGIDPQGLAEFFEIMEHEQGGLPGPLAWISTHPDHVSRINDINKTLQAAGNVSFKPFSFEWQEVVQRVRKQ
jgi:Zn-dependent protease with chaperone function